MDRIRLCALCGIAGQIILILGWAAGQIAQPRAYDDSSQQISDLGALTAAHPWIWNAADSVSGALTAIFALGLFALLRGERAGAVGAALIGVIGVGGVLDGLLREDCPLSTSHACRVLRDGPGLSWHHQAHVVESVIVGLSSGAVPFVLAFAFARLPAWRPLLGVTLATGVASGAMLIAYLVLYGGAGAGIAERGSVTVLAAWTAALTVRAFGLGGGRSRLDRPRGRQPRPAAR